MKSTSSRRVTSSDGMVEGRVDDRIEMCWSGIEFDCCQGEVFVVAIWAASGNRKSVSLVDSSRWRRNVRKTAEKGLRGRKRSGLDKSWGANPQSARALGQEPGRTTGPSFGVAYKAIA